MRRGQSLRADSEDPATQSPSATPLVTKKPVSRVPSLDQNESTMAETEALSEGSSLKSERVAYCLGAFKPGVAGLLQPSSRCKLSSNFSASRGPASYSYPASV